VPPETDRPDYDQTLKLLLAQAPEGFVALVAPDLTWRAQLPTDLPAVARQADVVMEVEDNSGRRGLLHVELQTKVEPDLGERLAEYGIRLWRRDHVPVRSVVVCFAPGTTVAIVTLRGRLGRAAAAPVSVRCCTLMGGTAGARAGVAKPGAVAAGEPDGGGDGGTPR